MDDIKLKVGKFLTEEFIAWMTSEGDTKTKKEFAEYLDVNPNQLRNWMTGIFVPGNQNVIKIGNKLGPKIYDLLGWVRPNNN